MNDYHVMSNKGLDVSETQCTASAKEETGYYYSGEKTKDSIEYKTIRF